MSLIHFGVKGQKWGVRKKRVNSSDYTSKEQLRKKKPRELSNDELKKAIERMNLESNFSRLKSESSAMKPGIKVVEKFMKEYGGFIITGLVGLTAPATLNFIKKQFLP